jgi:hypothetical protein
LGLVLGGADLGVGLGLILRMQIRAEFKGDKLHKRHVSRLAYTTCMKHEHLKPIGTRKGLPFTIFCNIIIIICITFGDIFNLELNWKLFKAYPNLS